MFVMRLPRLSGSEGREGVSVGAFNGLGWSVLTDYQGDRDLRVLLDGSSDVVDVGLVLVETILGNLVLAVGRKSRAVTVGQVVDDEGAHDGRIGAGGVLRLDVGEVSVHSGNLCGVVTEVIST